MNEEGLGVESNVCRRPRDPVQSQTDERGRARGEREPEQSFPVQLRDNLVAAVGSSLHVDGF